MGAFIIRFKSVTYRHEEAKPKGFSAVSFEITFCMKTLPAG